MRSKGGHTKRDTGVGAEFKHRVNSLYDKLNTTDRSLFMDMVLRELQCDSVGLDCRGTYKEDKGIPFKIRNYDYAIKEAGKIFDTRTGAG